MKPAQVDRSIEGRAAARLAGALEAEKRLTESLLAALKAERENLLSGRLEELYAACRERTELVERVRAGQDETARALADLAGAVGLRERPELSAAISRLSRQERPALRRLRAEVNRLRREAAALSNENRQCAAEALEFIDQAVAILTGATAGAGTYGERRVGSPPAILSSEV